MRSTDMLGISRGSKGENGIVAIKGKNQNEGWSFQAKS